MQDAQCEGSFLPLTTLSSAADKGGIIHVSDSIADMGGPAGSDSLAHGKVGVFPAGDVGPARVPPEKPGTCQSRH